MADTGDFDEIGLFFFADVDSFTLSSRTTLTLRLYRNNMYNYCLQRNTSLKIALPTQAFSMPLLRFDKFFTPLGKSFIVAFFAI